MTTQLVPSNAKLIDAPVKKVTLLEDRAQVRRSGKVSLEAGQHTVVVSDVAPVLQDVSLRADASAGVKVADVRVRRALKVTVEEKPEVARALEKDLEALTESMQVLEEERGLLDRRRQRVEEILERGFNELPQDVSWGLSAPQWKESLEGLYEKVRGFRKRLLEIGHELEALATKQTALVAQRRAFDRPDTRFVAWLEADVLVSSKSEVELGFEYTVPNALWRPMHSARLSVGRAPAFHFESRACVWQNTGEDWKDARLVFSTARSSLGIEPPSLSDDFLEAKKKSEKLVVQAREVAIQRASAGPGGGGPTSTAVELPGVDDGGEVRLLEAKGPCTIPSNGRPVVVPLFDFTATPTPKYVAFPELELRVFLTSLQKNEAKHPILAGPVELSLENGFVGWTQVLFVAPGESFLLSFGPDETVRVARTAKDKAQESHVDKWKTVSNSVWIFLSNVGDAARSVEVKERMPVSELEQVKVELAAKKTSPKPDVDANGFLTWNVELTAHSQTQLKLVYDLSTAPGVQGL